MTAIITEKFRLHNAHNSLNHFLNIKIYILPFHGTTPFTGTMEVPIQLH